MVAPRAGCNDWAHPPTESQILALVADAKTNAEVAASLFASPRTLEISISRVLSRSSGSQPDTTRPLDGRAAPRRSRRSAACGRNRELIDFRRDCTRAT